MIYALLAAMVMSAAAFGFGFVKGSSSRNVEIAKLTAAIEIATNKAKELLERDPVIEKQIVIEYRDRIVKVREVQPEIERQVEVIRAESPNCVLPPAFRMLHDSAATGSPPAETPAGVDGPAPVACDVAAARIAENYARARENAEQLRALQAWVEKTSPNSSEP